MGKWHFLATLFKSFNERATPRGAKLLRLGGQLGYPRFDYLQRLPKLKCFLGQRVFRVIEASALHLIEAVGEGNSKMLSLNQSAISPRTIASLHRCRESVFNISNRAPVWPDANPGEKPDELHAALARIGWGQVLLIRNRVIEASATARAILEREYRHDTGRETLYGALRQLVNRAGAQIPVGSTSWLATSAKEGITGLVSQVVNARSDETSTVILLDLDAHPEPTPRTLQRLFGFTAAETQLAVELVRGRNLLDIARSRRLSRATIRSHLAALFIKTHTRRQVELVALLGRVAVLP